MRSQKQSKLNNYCTHITYIYARSFSPRLLIIILYMFKITSHTNSNLWNDFVCVVCAEAMVDVTKNTLLIDPITFGVPDSANDIQQQPMGIKRIDQVLPIAYPAHALTHTCNRRLLVPFFFMSSWLNLMCLMFSTKKKKKKKICTYISILKLTKPIVTRRNNRTTNNNTGEKKSHTHKQQTQEHCVVGKKATNSK